MTAQSGSSVCLLSVYGEFIRYSNMFSYTIFLRLEGRLTYSPISNRKNMVITMSFWLQNFCCEWEGWVRQSINLTS